MEGVYLPSQQEHTLQLCRDGNWLKGGGRAPPTLTSQSSLGRYVFGSEISYNKAPPRLPGLGC